MTRPVQLPSEAEVRIAIEELRSATQNNTITVKQLAQQLGLTNPTFWRHFPDIAQEVADIRRAVRRTITDKTPPSLNNDAREQLLRKDNSILRAQIDIAAAHIQRLTLENQRIRSQLETQNHVVKFPGAPH